MESLSQELVKSLERIFPEEVANLIVTDVLFLEAMSKTYEMREKNATWRLYIDLEKDFVCFENLFQRNFPADELETHPIVKIDYHEIRVHDLIEDEPVLIFSPY